MNGRPRSCGRVPATSRMTLTSSGAYFDGRPDAFRGRSAAKPPVLNRRINARTYSSWRYNRPAMARARIPCPEKATTCARRKYAAVFVVFKTRVSRRPSASVSSRTYRHTGTSFGSHVCPYWIRRALKVQDAFRYEALGRLRRSESGVGRVAGALLLLRVLGRRRRRRMRRRIRRWHRHRPRRVQRVRALTSRFLGVSRHGATLEFGAHERLVASRAARPSQTSQPMPNIKAKNTIRANTGPQVCILLSGST